MRRWAVSSGSSSGKKWPPSSAVPRARDAIDLECSLVSHRISAATITSTTTMTIAASSEGRTLGPGLHHPV
jgi:hypothetical protein